ncbi:MAG: hypothetical protein IJT15_00010 [Rickettsiales bacterium]|nr:hypothetical protein [Rickettsiales bacterium]
MFGNGGNGGFNVNNGGMPNNFQQQQMIQQQMMQQQQAMIQQQMMQQQQAMIQQQMMQQNMFPQIQSNAVTGQQLFNDVITKIMPYTAKNKHYDFSVQQMVEDDATFDSMSLSLDWERLQKCINNVNVNEYKTNLAKYLSYLQESQIIGVNMTKAKKLDNNTIRVMDNTGDFIVDFSMQKITFYRIDDGNGTETKNFFSTNATTKNIQRIEYDFDKNNYVIFSTTADGERQWKFNLPGDDKISNITFNGHGVCIDFNTSSGGSNGFQFATTGQEESDFHNFCAKESINASLQLMIGNGYEGGYSKKEQPVFCTRCWNCCTQCLNDGYDMKYKI